MGWLTEQREIVRVMVEALPEWKKAMYARELAEAVKRSAPVRK